MEQKFYDKVLEKIQAIEAEMKRLGTWSNQPFDESLLENMGPFGSNTMPFTYWLQFVLIPRVHEIIKNEENFPMFSQVGIYAVREFDGNPEYSNLILLLNEFDRLF